MNNRLAEDAWKAMDDLMGEVVGTKVVQDWGRVNDVLIKLQSIVTASQQECPEATEDGPEYPDGPWAPGWAERSGAVAVVYQNESGQISLRTPEGDAWDMSQYVGFSLYAEAGPLRPKHPEITEDEAAKICRAFWRRIYPYRNQYEKELPKDCPVEFVANMLTALSILDQQKPSPNINATFECEENGITGSTSVEVKRVEQQDDGSFEVVLDYWPPKAHRDTWKNPETNPPEMGVPVIGWHPDWVDPDFNEKGIRECFRFGDGTAWNNAYWWGEDELEVCEVKLKEGAPKLWRHYPAAPSEGEKE